MKLVKFTIDDSSIFINPDFVVSVKKGIKDTSIQTTSEKYSVKETVELSIIDQRKFRFMVDEVPNFAAYIMGVLARRIRGMSQAI